VESAEDAVGIQKRVHLGASPSSQQFACDPPGLGPAVLAVQIRPALRGGGDLEPTDGLNAQPSEWVSAPNFSTVYFANSVMVLDGLVWNTRPGACDDDPPVVNNGPRSSTVTSVQPAR
jgi:hypothetical protein